MTGTIEEPRLKVKSAEFKGDELRLDEALGKIAVPKEERNRRAVTAFDLAQRAAEVWQGSNSAVRRRLLDAVCLNRALSDVSLVTVKRKPFDQLAKPLQNDFSRGDMI